MDAIHPQPGADWRPVTGRPGYFIDRDKAVWSTTRRGGIPGRPGPWRTLVVTMRGRNGTTPCVRFPEPDGRQRFASVAKLHRAAFLDPPPFPEGSPRGSARRTEDDDPDWCRPSPTPTPIPRPLAVAPLPLGSPRMTIPEDDEWAETPYAVAPVATSHPLAVAPAALPEGGMRPTVRGSDHGRAKLDEPKVIEMRRLRREDWSTGRIARMFGISRNTACLALNGTTWSHVPGAIAPNGGTQE
jgi:hypothetical protein